ncbi:hypothetical protein [Streptomyces cinereospinus]|uniref:Secreted protein n=1 Tax=Streptomyces cinereospinus TaxID=285561 RepID=A0ABV5N5G8_9ACTN
MTGLRLITGVPVAGGGPAAGGLAAAAGTGLRPTGAAGPAGGFHEVVTAVQAGVPPYGRNHLRPGDRLTASPRPSTASGGSQSRASLHAGGGHTVRAGQAVR